MKKTITVLGICLLTCLLSPWRCPGAEAVMEGEPAGRVVWRGEDSDSVLVAVSRFSTPVVFEVNRYDIRRTPLLDEAVDSIVAAKDRLFCVMVNGSASPDGPYRWNLELGQHRADALASYLSRETGLEAGSFRISNAGEDWLSVRTMLENNADFVNRNLVLEIISREQDNETRKRRIQELDGGKTWRRMVDSLFPPLRNARIAIVCAYPWLSGMETDLTAQPLLPVPPCTGSLIPRRPVPGEEHPVTAGAGEWRIAAKTNLLFDAALVANLGVEISPAAHWSLDLPVWYSPYSITPTRKLRLLAVQPELRWWPKEAMRGHFVGLHAHVAGFNVAINDNGRYQDPNQALWGLGLSYGYSMQLGRSDNWGLEFNVGAGFAEYSYDAYRNCANGQKFGSGSGCYWGITRAGITLYYKWDLPSGSRKR